jgi:hypothetical protein
MTRKEVLMRITHIARVKGIALNGHETLELAKFYEATPKAELPLLRAANLGKAGVVINGTDWLELAEYLA